jgi:hypothetical protein
VEIYYVLKYSPTQNELSALFLVWVFSQLVKKKISFFSFQKIAYCNNHDAGGKRMRLVHCFYFHLPSMTWHMNVELKPEN